MPDTLTIYNSGTDYDRSNSNELIASLALKTEGAEGDSWLLNPGPGSTELYLKSLRARIGAALVAGIFKSRAVGEFAAQKYGTVTGSGMGVNVAATVELVRRLQPKRINMAGWSRGAITCIEIANKLVETSGTEGIDIRLFLVDPVPGRGNLWNWTDASTRLPPNVRQSAVILQEGADWKGFLMQPLIDPFRASDERRKTYPMPGPHSASVEVQKPFEPVAKMARFLVETFLSERGTPLKSVLLLNPKSICELYGQMMHALGEAKARDSSRQNVPNDLRYSRLFVNSHHREQSELAFPSVTRAFIGLARPSIEEGLKASITAQARVMAQDAPNAWQAFGRALMIDIVGTQPVQFPMPLGPPGAAIGMPGSKRFVTNPPTLRMTQRQEFLLRLFRGG